MKYNIFITELRHSNRECSTRKSPTYSESSPTPSPLRPGLRPAPPQHQRLRLRDRIHPSLPHRQPQPPGPPQQIQPPRKTAVLVNRQQKMPGNCSSNNSCCNSSFRCKDNCRSYRPIRIARRLACDPLRSPYLCPLLICRNSIPNSIHHSIPNSIRSRNRSLVKEATPAYRKLRLRLPSHPDSSFSSNEIPPT